MKYVFSEDFLATMEEGEDETKSINPISCRQADFKELISYFVVKQVGEVDKLRNEIVTLRGENQALQTAVDGVVTENISLRDEVNDLKAESEAQQTTLNLILNRIVVLENFKESALKTMAQSSDRILKLERHSRSKNLRFVVKVKEKKDENTTQILLDQLKEVGLNPRIEYSHRVGKPDESTINPKPRQIIAAFLERPDRFKVINKRKELFDKGVQVYDDLCKEDYDLKKLHKDFMQGLHDNQGKKVRFTRGVWYINGQKFGGIEDLELYS